MERVGGGLVVLWLSVLESRGYLSCLMCFGCKVSLIVQEWRGIRGLTATAFAISRSSSEHTSTLVNYEPGQRSWGSSEFHPSISPKASGPGVSRV